MKILELNIENFLVLTSASIKLADRGLMLIQGVNSADSSATSNGAGKSSIADALCWVLYGTTARGETGDTVVNNVAGKGTRVEVKILDNMTFYRIVRHRKHKAGKNALHVFMDDGMTGEKDLTKGTDKLTQDVANKIIGASLDVFSGSIYAGQEKMPDLPAMTDKMLKMLIEEAAGINALEEAYKKARENAQAAQVDVRWVENEITARISNITNIGAQIDQAEESENTWFQNKQDQIKTLTDRVRDQIIPAAKSLAAVTSKEMIADVANQILTIDAKIASVSQEQTFLEGLTRTEMLAERDVTTKQAVEVNLRTEVQQLTNRLAAVDHKVGCPCDTCGRPLTVAEMAITRSKIEKDIAEARKNFTTAAIAVEDTKNTWSAARIAVERFKQGMTDLSKEMAQRAALEAQKGVLEQNEARREALVVQARNDMATIDRIKNEPSPFTSQIDANKAKIHTIESDIQNLRNELEVHQKRLAIENEVVRVFSPAGVRARILDEVTPYLNSQTSKYLSVLSDGNITAEWSTLNANKSGELKERFAIDVSSGISAKTFKGLSGGEKRKVRVATALALQDLVATRASKPIDLFIGDEIDDALDASGLERLMIILEEKARERGTVMVISHNSLKDEIRQVLNIERTATGETKISETAA